MKLAEALLLRSEYQKKMNNLYGRTVANLKVQEGDEPAENPRALISEALEKNGLLCALIKEINDCNNKVVLPNGLTLSQAVVEREMIAKKRNFLAAIAKEASDRDYRLTRAEIKMNLAVSVEDLQKQIEALSQDWHGLDTQIQAANWTAELQ